MERKTMGTFLAALRKANGMTQKELARRLNVSDKSVSRWERDDGAPDLSLIPVIAEIFGVTCDELLRGERRGAEAENTAEPTPKGEKQRQRLLAAGLTRFQNRTYIAMGISVVGLIAALIGNLAFYRAVLGALLGAVFFAASVVCQIIFVNSAFSAVADSGVADDELGRFRCHVIRLTRRSIGLTVAFAGFTFPLVWVDAYMGLGSDSLLLFGAIGAAAFLVVYAVVWWFLDAGFVARGVYALSEWEEQVWRHKRKWLRRCALALVIAWAVTFAAYLTAQSVWSPVALAEKIDFYDADSFVAFMEQDVSYEGPIVGEVAPESAVEILPGEITWYDEYGNIISEEEALRETLTDSEGNVLVEYIRRRGDVADIRCGEGDDLFPIQVVTKEALYAAQSKHALLDAAFAGAAVLEGLVAVVVLLVKRKKYA